MCQSEGDGAYDTTREHTLVNTEASTAPGADPHSKTGYSQSWENTAASRSLSPAEHLPYGLSQSCQVQLCPRQPKAPGCSGCTTKSFASFRLPAASRMEIPAEVQSTFLLTLFICNGRLNRSNGASFLPANPVPNHVLCICMHFQYVHQAAFQELGTPAKSGESLWLFKFKQKLYKTGSRIPRNHIIISIWEL